MNRTIIAYCLLSVAAGIIGGVLATVSIEAALISIAMMMIVLALMILD